MTSLSWSLVSVRAQGGHLGSRFWGLCFWDSIIAQESYAAVGGLGTQQQLLAGPVWVCLLYLDLVPACVPY